MNRNIDRYIFYEWQNTWHKIGTCGAFCLKTALEFKEKNRKLISSYIYKSYIKRYRRDNSKSLYNAIARLRKKCILKTHSAWEHPLAPVVVEFCDDDAIAIAKEIVEDLF